MKMSEAAASKCYCPAVFQGGSVDYCRGSRCMAWRWVPKLSSWVEGAEKVQEIHHDKGYCGLAGVPS